MAFQVIEMGSSPVIRITDNSVMVTCSAVTGELAIRIRLVRFAGVAQQ